MRSTNMKLYRVETKYVSYVLARDEHAARRVAERDAVGHDDPADQSAVLATVSALVRDGTGGQRPWGIAPDDARTCLDILAEAAGRDAA
jgi:hypothetical protein